MKSFRHWTPHYVRGRLAVALYERRHPDHPWLTRDANVFLAQWLKPTDQGLEFGSGRSTLWLARRVAHLLSTEENPQWAQRVRVMIRDAGAMNVTHVDVDHGAGADPAAQYLEVLKQIPDGSIDFCLVDGEYRDICSKASLCKIRPGGIIIIDDVHKYLPSMSRSPTARSPSAGPASPTWADVASELSPWRTYWTSSGIKDTAIFFKPTAVSRA